MKTKKHKPDLFKPVDLLTKHVLVKQFSTHEVPFHVWTLFGPKQKEILLWGKDISLGEDCGSLEQCREAIAWYVEQFGGVVTWNKE